MSRIELVNHGSSGEIYVLEYGDGGAILRCAGPLHHTEADALRNDASARGDYLDNQDEARDDAEWAGVQEWREYYRGSKDLHA